LKSHKLAGACRFGQFMHNRIKLKMMSFTETKQRGVFTLIELLVVTLLPVRAMAKVKTQDRKWIDSTSLRSGRQL
jgi:hypothetical protein